MNFDELHDPDPPRPTAATLAAVARRARTIRRCRTAMVTGGAIIAAAAVVVPTALVVTGQDDDGGRLVPASVPASDPTAISQPPETVNTVPSTESTTFPPIPTTTLAPVERPVVVAIKRNGDVVSIDATGAETLLFEGAPDPGRYPEDEEDGRPIVDSVAVMADGRVYVSTCCEPEAGMFFELGAAEAEPQPGHGLAVSPDGTRLATVAEQELFVRDIDGQSLASAAALGGAEPYAVTWIDDQRLAVLYRAAVDGKASLGIVSISADGFLEGLVDGAVEIPVDPAVAGRVPVPSFGGISGSGSVLVLASDAAETLLAFDPTTLERRPAEDVTLPFAGTSDGVAISAWVDDGVVSWVNIRGVLHVGDAVFESGDFRWVRRFG